MIEDVKRHIRTNSILFRFYRHIKRPYIAGQVAARGVKRAVSWYFNSSEVYNYTYDLHPNNERHLVAFVANVTGDDYETIEDYISELESNTDLRQHLKKRMTESDMPFADKDIQYGRRKGWYALLRSLKPDTVLETGVDQGLGTCVLAAAIRQNIREGHNGYIYATEIDEQKGQLFTQPYSNCGEVLYGDSIEMILGIDDPINFYIHDSLHERGYERREIEAAWEQRGEEITLISDAAWWSPELLNFALENDLSYRSFEERSENHWYRGGGIGLAR